MRNLKRKICACLFPLLALTFCISLPMGASAETGTLGTQTPKLEANYYTVQADESLKLVDGNALTSGSYVMELTVSDLASISHFELTAGFNKDVLTFDSISVLPEITTGFDAINSKINSELSGELIVGFVSTNKGACTALTDGTAVIFRANITIDSTDPVNMFDGDDAVITVNPNPNLTFIEADYGDVRTVNGQAVYDCYGLGAAADYDYPGTVYPMEIDLSPMVAVTVSGSVIKMTNPADPNKVSTAANVALEGVTLTINDEVVATTDSTGAYSFDIAPGNYVVTLSYKYSADRTVNLIVGDTDITATAITMVACDFKQDGKFNITDFNQYKSRLKSSVTATKNEADLNGDNKMNITDTNLMKKFIKVGNSYATSLYEGSYAVTIQ